MTYETAAAIFIDLAIICAVVASPFALIASVCWVIDKAEAIHNPRH